MQKLTKKNAEMRIPKIIHQTCPNKLDLNDLIVDNISNIKKLNPDWQYNLYDDSDCVEFISNKYGQRYVDLFNKINPEYGAAKADLFRYLLLYSEGGVYLDLKSTTLGPLSTVIKDNDSYILSTWENGPGAEFEGVGHWDKFGVPNEFQQWHIICVPKHPFLKAIIEQVAKNIDSYNPFVAGIGTIGTIRTTGPIVYTKVIQQILHLHSYRFATNTELNIKYSIFRTKNAEHRLYIGNDYTLSVKPIIGSGIFIDCTCTYAYKIRNILKKFERVFLRKIIKMTFKYIWRVNK